MPKNEIKLSVLFAERNELEQLISGKNSYISGLKSTIKKSISEKEIIEYNLNNIEDVENLNNAECELLCNLDYNSNKLRRWEKLPNIFNSYRCRTHIYPEHFPDHYNVIRNEQSHFRIAARMVISDWKYSIKSLNDKINYNKQLIKDSDRLYNSYEEDLKKVSQKIENEKRRIDQVQIEEAQKRERELKDQEQKFNNMLNGMSRASQAQSQNSLEAERERTRQLELEVRLKELEIEALKANQSLNDEYREILAELDRKR